MSKGKLYVISGPSGAGKSTISKILVKEANNLFLSTSATTRKARAGEKDGIDYYFFSKEEFEKNIKENNFIEYALVHGNYYGTLKSEVEKNLNEGKDILLEIDVQGGEQVKKQFPETVLIFVKAPNEKELEKRLRGRATDDEEVIQVRLKNSLKELEYEKFYDRVVVNETVNDSVKKIIEIMDKTK